MRKPNLSADEINDAVNAMEAADLDYDDDLDAIDNLNGDYTDELLSDGQPDEYTEWQDLYGGDDWDHGQYDAEIDF
jgi:hypothetical protein